MRDEGASGFPPWCAQVGHAVGIARDCEWHGDPESVADLKRVDVVYLASEKFVIPSCTRWQSAQESSSKICERRVLFCAASRANYVLRVVHPENSFQFAIHHDAGIRQCLENLLHIPVIDAVWAMASLPFGTPPDHSILVKLGGHTPHDSGTPFTCGRPHAGLTIPRPRRVPRGSSTREPRLSFACRRSCTRMG